MIRPFGEVGGVPIRTATISNGAVSAEVMEWGATLLSMRLEGCEHNLTLSLPDLETYLTHGQHMGAIAGRFAGRIGGGFSLDGERFETTKNDGEATLHGGAQGFGVSPWTFAHRGANFVELAIRQPEGLDGFPGMIDAHCRYEALDDGLKLVLTAMANRPTVCNLAQHSYFNLPGAASIDEHELWIASNRITPLGDDLLPDGSVAQAPAEIDFSTRRLIGPTMLDDHFILADARRRAPELAARLTCGGVEMTIETTEPGLVVYSGDKLPGAPRAGLCLECQLWPDAPNQPNFPSAVLRPGETYRQETVYRLRHI